MSINLHYLYAVSCRVRLQRPSLSCRYEKELGDAWSGGCKVYKVEYRIIDLYVEMLISVPLPQQQNTT